MPETQNINLNTSFDISISNIDHNTQIENVIPTDNFLTSSTDNFSNKEFKRGLLLFDENNEMLLNEIIKNYNDQTSIEFIKTYLCDLSSDFDLNEFDSVNICMKFKFDNNNSGKLKLKYNDKILKEFDFQDYSNNQNYNFLCKLDLKDNV